MSAPVHQEIAARPPGDRAAATLARRIRRATDAETASADPAPEF